MRIDTDIGRIGAGVAFLLLMIAFLSSSAAAANVTLFNQSYAELGLTYPRNGDVKSFYLMVPNGTVTRARMRISGFTYEGQHPSPADVMLVTDTSSSMSSNSKLANAKLADISFINNTEMQYVHVGLVHYATTPLTMLDTGLTADNNSLIAMIRTYVSNGLTDMGKGMNLSIDEMLGPRGRPGVKRYLIVMTDGIANCYPTSSNPFYNCDNGPVGRGIAANYVRQVAQRAKDNNIVVYTIGFGSGGTDPANMTFLGEIANMTNGSSYFAPGGSQLIQIYNDIANMISYQDFPTPAMRTVAPMGAAAWQVGSQYDQSALWSGSSCGFGSATCMDFVWLVQQNLDSCLSNPCRIDWSVRSSSVGAVNLSQLFIEINEPPTTEYPINGTPPEGRCLKVLMNCSMAQDSLSLDDGTLASDVNDAPETLAWLLDHLEYPAASAPFTYNADFNASREFRITAGVLNMDYNQVFVLNVSDPWRMSAQACINASFSGCGLLEVRDDNVPFNRSNATGVRYSLSTLVSAYVPPGPAGTIIYQILGLDGFLHSACFSFTAPDASTSTLIRPLNPGPDCAETIQVNISDATYPSLGWHLANLTLNYSGLMTSCGNGIVELGEECDDGNIEQGDGCNATCMLEPGFSLGLLNRAVRFNYSYHPTGLSYNLTGMLSPFASMPCPEQDLFFEIVQHANFTISFETSPGGEIVRIVPRDWFANLTGVAEVSASCSPGGVLYKDAANLSISYVTDEAPAAVIACSGANPRYVLHDGIALVIDPVDIFTFIGPAGTVTGVTSSSGHVLVGIDSGRLSVTSNGLVFGETAVISITTDAGITSDSCSVGFFDLATNCDKDACRACVGAQDYGCMVLNGCLDNHISVYNPYALTKPTRFMPQSMPAAYMVSSFTGLTPGRFLIDPGSGDPSQLFAIEGKTNNIRHGVRDAAIARIEITGYNNNPAWVCPELIRMNYSIGAEPFVPDTELLMPASRTVNGYIELPGSLLAGGHYIFTAKVWQR